MWWLGFFGGSDSKESACNAGDSGSIPGSGRSPGEGNGNPLQYSCLENPMDGGAWWATVHGVSKSWTRLSDFTFTFWDVGRLWSKHCAFGLCLDLWSVVGVVKLWVQLSVVFFCFVLFFAGEGRKMPSGQSWERGREWVRVGGEDWERNIYILAADWTMKGGHSCLLKGFGLVAWHWQLVC